jgi:hypothetical protein
MQDCISLRGKTIYGFGDSLIAGHLIKVGMLHHIVKKNEMIFLNYAQNGATVIAGDFNKMSGLIDTPNVAQQIQNASDVVPDYVCFNGMTNDAFQMIIDHQLGEISDSFDGGYDLTSFTGALENICLLLKNKYRDSHIIYVTPHRMPIRSMNAQITLCKRAKEVCNKWTIPVVDIFNKGEINTCIETMRDKYTYYKEDRLDGGDGMHLNAEGYIRWYAPKIEAELIRITER